jgi:Na+/melibiose symporter-like transporter
VTAPGSWRPLTASRATDAFTVTPFTRLARVHAFSVATDTLVTVSLAGTLFFSIPSGAARDKVALYLLLTMAPFAIVAPLVGPAIDRIRGGRRFMVVLATGLRALVCLFMVQHVNDLFLFPAAFLILVLGKAYGIAKAALVPTVVNDDTELVRANSRLSLVSGIVGLVAGAPGALIVKFIGPEAAIVCAAATSATASILATRLSAAIVADQPPEPAEEVELRGAGIVHAAEAMGLLRGIVGFLTFLLAFDLKGGGSDAPVPVGLSIGRAVRHLAQFPEVGTGHPATAPTWHFGAVLVASIAGALVGALIAPRLRQAVSEERILIASLGAVAIVAVGCALQGGLLGSAGLALMVGVGASAGRLAFDAIVQRDAPDANYGRSFAGFETRFQLLWVIGGFLPVIVPIPARVGFIVVAGAAGFGAYAYRRAWRVGVHGPVASPTAVSAGVSPL